MLFFLINTNEAGLVIIKLSLFVAVFFKILPALNRVIAAKQRVVYSLVSLDKIYDYEKRGIPYDESTSEFILEKDIDLHRFKGTMNHYLRERYHYEKKNEHNFSPKKVKIKINPLSKSKAKGNKTK